MAEDQEPAQDIQQQAADYLLGLLRDFRNPSPLKGHAPDRTCPSVDNVLDILCSRRFTHLSQARSLPYRESMQSQLHADLSTRRALRFCYDLGAGYHASLEPDFTGLRFAPGLGELLALRQILGFSRAVERIYPPGVHFRLVIDNLCAWKANDIPLEHTEGYLAQLQALISDLGLHERVEILAESRVINSTLYQASFARLQPPLQTEMVSASDKENVSRFVGHACTEDEVRSHLARYQHAQAISEQLLARHLDGIRLTQRASAQVFGFRSFPGGDSRLQSGEVDLLICPGSQPKPMLLTTRNRQLYRRWALGHEYLPPNWPLAPGVVHVATTR